MGEVCRGVAMRSQALASASRYTLDNVVANFCDGIERCLAMGKNA